MFLFTSIDSSYDTNCDIQHNNAIIRNKKERDEIRKNNEIVGTANMIHKKRDNDISWETSINH